MINVMIFKIFLAYVNDVILFNCLYRVHITSKYCIAFIIIIDQREGFERIEASKFNSHVDIREVEKKRTNERLLSCSFTALQNRLNNHERTKKKKFNSSITELLEMSFYKTKSSKSHDDDEEIKHLTLNIDRPEKMFMRNSVDRQIIHQVGIVLQEKRTEPE